MHLKLLILAIFLEKSEVLHSEFAV